MKELIKNRLDRRLLLILVLFISLQGVCRCYLPMQLDIKEYNEADIIFIGKLKKITNCRLLTYSFQFEVIKTYKGRKIHESILIKTNKWPVKEDGFYGKIGKTYIIVANKGLFRYYTNQCCPNSLSERDSFFIRDSLIFKKDSLFLEFMNLNKNSRIDSTMNKNITGSGQMKNGFPDGLWTYYNYRHGRPFAVGRYINGKMDSIWDFYSEKQNLPEQNIYTLLPTYNPNKQRYLIGQEIYEKGKLMAQIFYESEETQKKTHIEIEIYAKNVKINYDDYQKIKGKVVIYVFKYTFFGGRKDIKKLELNH